MKTFPLTIGTPDGISYEGEVERVIVRSISGDLAILAGHINFVTSLGMGEATVVLPNNQRRKAACIGGMLSMMNGKCRVLATTWEWEDDIDLQRADRSRERAQKILSNGGLSDEEYKVAKARLQRALVRIGVKSH